MTKLGDPGVIVPPMTPFTADGAIDYDAYETQLEFIIAETGATSIPLMAVEAQEYRCLDVDARQDAIRRGATIIDGRLPIIVGASADSYQQAIEIGSIAREVDAAALQLLIPRRPQGGDTRIAELVAFFEQVHDALGLPLVAYHNPGPGADLSVDELIQLAKSDAVIAFKESSRNLRHVTRAIEHIDHPDLANYYTTMEMSLITLLLGGSGITVPAPPAVVVSDIVDAVQRGDIEAAATRQRAFADFPAPFLKHGFPTVMKAALEHMGIPSGTPYPPAQPVPDTDRRDIAEALDALGVSSQ